ncbi:MAG: hypothetical protein ACTSQE_07295 [Candidatus Heimdallarchaeaceae archaeon]
MPKQKKITEKSYKPKNYAKHRDAWINELVEANVNPILYKLSQYPIIGRLFSMNTGVTVEVEHLKATKGTLGGQKIVVTNNGETIGERIFWVKK